MHQILEQKLWKTLTWHCCMCCNPANGRVGFEEWLAYKIQLFNVLNETKAPVFLSCCLAPSLCLSISKYSCLCFVSFLSDVNKNYEGYQISYDLNVQSPEECRALCLAMAGCEYFSYNCQDKNCCYKSEQGTKVPEKYSFAAPKTCK